MKVVLRKHGDIDRIVENMCGIAESMAQHGDQRAKVRGAQA